MAGAVRRLALDAVLPALERAVDDRRRLAGVELERPALRRDDLLQVVAVGHVDDVPVVQVEELPRVPLHVVAGAVAVAADVVGVDRRLVPVDVQDDVVERGRAGRGQRLGDAARREAALALDDVHAGRVRAEAVAGAEREAERARDADARGAGRELHERRRRRRVSVERLRRRTAEQRRRGDRVAAEAEQVLEPQPLHGVGRQQAGAGRAGDLVAQRPHRVQAHRLVAGGVRDDVGVVAIGIAEVVVDGVEEERRDEAARRDRAAGMARGRHVVVEQRAERAVEQVERLEVRELVGRQRRRRRRRR